MVPDRQSGAWLNEWRNHWPAHTGTLQHTDTIRLNPLSIMVMIPLINCCDIVQTHNGAI
jgi:hypothetical protein